MQLILGPVEASPDVCTLHDKQEAAAQSCVDHILEERTSAQAWDDDDRRVAKTSRRRAKGAAVPVFRDPQGLQLDGRYFEKPVFTYSVSGDAAQVDVPIVPPDPQYTRPAFLLQPQRGLQTVPQMMRPQQRPQQHEQMQPKGLMQQLAERQAQRSFPGPQQPPTLPQPPQNGRMLYGRTEYSQQLGMNDGSAFSRGRAPVFNCEYNGEAFGASMRASEGAEKVAPVHMQHPAGMPGMLHPDGMYCGPLAFPGQGPERASAGEQPGGQHLGHAGRPLQELLKGPGGKEAAQPVVQQLGQPCFPQLLACQQNRHADTSMSEASPTDISGVRTETDTVDEAHQFRAALRYASQPILSDAKMRSRAACRAETEQHCGSDNESLSSQACVGRTPVKGERAPSPSSDCTASTRELAPSVQLSAAGHFGALGRAATGRCGIYA